MFIFNAKTRTLNVSCTAEASLLRNGGDTIAVSVAHQQPRLEFGTTSGDFFNC